MSGPGTDRRAEDRLFEEAATWFARMRGPDAQSSREDFEAWLALGEPNRSAYSRAAEIFAMGKVLSEGDDRLNGGGTRAGHLRRPSFASLVLLAITAAAAWFAVLDYRWHKSLDGTANDGRGVQVALLATAAGEQRLFKMADGSVVRLGGSTRIAARFSGGQRSLTLDRGRARFQVAHESRPFVVHAGGGAITAHGTVFDVALATDRRVSVRLLEGSVEVRLPPSGRRGAPDAVQRLRPGETISFAATRPVEGALSAPGGPASSGPPAPGAPGGEASEYDLVRLADLVAAANRGASRPIRIADARTGERRVSGWFRIDDTGLLAERLALLFDLSVDRTSPAELVLKGR